MQCKELPPLSLQCTKLHMQAAADAACLCRPQYCLQRSDGAASSSMWPLQAAIAAYHACFMLSLHACMPDCVSCNERNCSKAGMCAGSHQGAHCMGWTMIRDGVSFVASSKPQQQCPSHHHAQHACADCMSVCRLHGLQQKQACAAGGHKGGAVWAGQHPGGASRACLPDARPS